MYTSRYGRQTNKIRIARHGISSDDAVHKSWFLSGVIELSGLEEDGCFSVFFWIGIKLSRVISTGRLSALPRVHSRPINVVVFHDPWGDLVLRGASRLDAFSGYPFRT